MIELELKIAQTPKRYTLFSFSDEMYFFGEVSVGKFVIVSMMANVNILSKDLDKRITEKLKGAFNA